MSKHKRHESVHEQLYDLIRMLIPVIAQSHYDVCSALDHISTNDSFAYIKQDILF